MFIYLSNFVSLQKSVFQFAESALLSEIQKLGFTKDNCIPIYFVCPEEQSECLMNAMIENKIRMTQKKTAKKKQQRREFCRFSNVKTLRLTIINWLNSVCAHCNFFHCHIHNVPE